MPDLIDDLRRYGTALESRSLPMVRFPGAGDQANEPRHRGRNTWWVAAALLVAVVATIGLLARSASQDEAPSVDTVADQDLPLLGFEGQPLNLRHIVPGVSYEVFDTPDGLAGVVQATLFVTVVSEPDPRPDGASPDDRSATVTPSAGDDHSTVVVDGRQVAIVRTPGETGEILTATWRPKSGTMARLTVTYGTRGTDREDVFRSAATRVTGISRADLVAALLPPGPYGQNLTPLVTPKADQTTVLDSYPTETISLDLRGHPTGPAHLEILGPGSGGANLPYYAERGTPATVRGGIGTFLAGSAPSLDGLVHNYLYWEESGGLYSLDLTGDASAADAVALADSLRPPSPLEWEALILPRSS
jgi:hypothetical protein